MTKVFVISGSKLARCNHVQFLPETTIVGIPEEADVIFVDWTHISNFEAEVIQRIVNSRKPVVVLDYLEYPEDDRLFLTCPETWNASLHPCALLKELENSIKVYFKRELTRARVPALPYPVYATDYVTEMCPEDEVADTAEVFNARPIDFFMFWGYSSNDRPRLHAELMRRAFAGLATTLKDIDWLIEKGRKGIYALLHTPVYRRVPLPELLQYQKRAKISISLRGSSQKCFRHAEAPLNSVMALQCSTEFAFPWNKTNSVILPSLSTPSVNPYYWIDVPASVTALFAALEGDLYSVYLAGVENARHYKSKNYVQEHWLPLMRKHGAWV